MVQDLMNMSPFFKVLTALVVIFVIVSLVYVITK